MTCPKCQNRSNETASRCRWWCPTCKWLFGKPESDFRPHAVEYLELHGKEKLHLRSKGFRTKCGLKFTSKEAVPRFFREEPKNVCQKCLSL